VIINYYNFSHQLVLQLVVNLTTFKELLQVTRKSYKEFLWRTLWPAVTDSWWYVHCDDAGVAW